MKAWHVVSRYAGIAAIPMYILFTAISALQSGGFSPLRNWLSDYGNPHLNPAGALWYNLGCILTAALLAVFYAGLAQWYRGRRMETKYVVCYIGAQTSGLAAAGCLVMASAIPLGVNDAVHSTFSTLNMIGMDCFLNFTAIAFLMHPQMPKAYGVLALLASMFNIVSQNAFHNFYVSEWIYFVLFMACLTVLTAYHAALSRYESAVPRQSHSPIAIIRKPE
jgi:hypothetical membrane protein